MITAAVFVLVAFAGITVGAVAHAYIAKEAAATQMEIAGWAQELRNALAADANGAKAKVESLIKKLEAKL